MANMHGSNPDREKVIGLIRKLLATANDARGNENEAASAAAKAAALMRKYELDAIDVVAQEVELRENFERATCSADFQANKKDAPRKVPDWAGFIALGVGALFTCKVDITYAASTKHVGDQEVVLRFSGFSSDVLMCQWVFRFLGETVFRLSREYAQSQGMAAAKNFRSGAGAALQKKLYAMAKAQTDELKAQPSTGTALVVMNRKAEQVQSYFGETKTRTKSARTSDVSAYMAGRIAGENVNVPTNRPIGDATAKPNRPLTGTTQRKIA